MRAAGEGHVSWQKKNPKNQDHKMTRSPRRLRKLPVFLLGMAIAIILEMVFYKLVWNSLTQVEILIFLSWSVLLSALLGGLVSYFIILMFPPVDWKSCAIVWPIFVLAMGIIVAQKFTIFHSPTGKYCFRCNLPAEQSAFYTREFGGSKEEVFFCQEHKPPERIILSWSEGGAPKPLQPPSPSWWKVFYTGSLFAVWAVVLCKKNIKGFPWIQVGYALLLLVAWPRFWYRSEAFLLLVSLATIPLLTGLGIIFVNRVQESI